MRSSAAAIVLALVAAPALAVPSFPSSWSSANYGTKLLLFQGGTHNDTSGVACCPRTSPQCKVQAQGIAGAFFNDGVNNRTLLSAGQSGVMTLFQQGKQLSVVPSSSGKGWTCKEYCPLTDQNNHYFNPLTFDASAQDQGAETINGKSYEKYHWYDSILKIIHMDEQVWYVDQSGSQPVPYLNIQKLTPFGGAEIATSTQFFDSFSASAPPSDTWAVDNLDSCEKSEQCGQNNAAFFMKHFAQFQPTVLSKATALAASTKQDTSAEPPRAVESGVSWPSDYTADETSDTLIDQGGAPNADDSAICCASSYGDQCQVQLGHQAGTRYYDYTNQRTRFEDPVNGIVVDDFKTHKSMLVVHNGTHDVCEKYCPLDPRETLDEGRGNFLDDNATDLGQVTFNGEKVEQWQWKDTILKVITMQVNNFYADISTGNAVPVAAVSDLTPFGGPKIGQQNQTWTNFKAGTPPASKFDIQGMDTCPQDPQCGQQARQLYRLASGQLYTWARYQRA